MDMSGEQRIEAPRPVVWEALNDPEVLKVCIPGCDELERVGDDGFAAKVTAKVGPVKARFSGEVTLSDIVPPESYKITGEGKGGPAGFAKGGATVNLAEDGTTTILTYEVHANVGGKLAQLGGRLIQGTAKKMAGDFFSRFAVVVAERTAGEVAAAPTDAAPAEVEPVEAAPAEAVPAEAVPAEAVIAEAPAETPAAEVVPQVVEAPTAEVIEPTTAQPVAEAAEEPATIAEEAPAEPAPAPEVPAPAPAAEPPAPAASEDAHAEPEAGGLPPVVWVGAVIAIAVILIAVFS